ncbi:hypothetical protein [Corynebacterium sp. TAE3-ERU30]|uniref:GAP1-N2 domain-containing protein n=1 Tax=Corynebacterium sp. TAE3-ERU30 TaxID=2849496 RepID=UPI001C492E4B|nr:hypothetical protein [Corynebacterium sp. TAE3-ERU30]MBV7282573.1 hypothetical protein [Corynebacterium sp. TAE3-ERU30]
MSPESVSSPVLGTFSFASFGRSSTRAGGWGVGDSTGRITQQLIAQLRPTIPSTLVDGARFGNYPSSAEIAHLNRRFAWLPTSDAEGNTVWAFYASCHAGQDASGRPGNVFTFVQVHDSAAQVDPIRMMYSPQIPAPFGKREVDAAALPAAITEPGPLSDVVLRRFLTASAESAELPVPWENLSAHSSGGPRREYVDAAVAALRTGAPVVLACPLAESPLWVAAVYRAHGENTSFATFHNAERLADMLGTKAQLVAVRAEHVELAREVVPEHAVVLDVTAPLPEELRAPSTSATDPIVADPAVTDSAVTDSAVADPAAAPLAAPPQESAQQEESSAAWGGQERMSLGEQGSSAATAAFGDMQDYPSFSFEQLGPLQQEWPSSQGAAVDDAELSLSDEEFVADLERDVVPSAPLAPPPVPELSPGGIYNGECVVTDDDLRLIRLPLRVFVERMTLWYNTEGPKDAVTNTRMVIRMNRLAAITTLSDDILRLRARCALVALISDVHACDSIGPLLQLQRHDLDRLQSFFAKEIDDLLAHKDAIEEILYCERTSFRCIEDAVAELMQAPENQDSARYLGPQIQRLLRDSGSDMRPERY